MPKFTFTCDACREMGDVYETSDIVKINNHLLVQHNIKEEDSCITGVKEIRRA